MPVHLIMYHHIRMDPSSPGDLYPALMLLNLRY